MLRMFLRKVRGITRQDANRQDGAIVRATTGATGTRQDGAHRTQKSSRPPEGRWLLVNYSAVPRRAWAYSTSTVELPLSALARGFLSALSKGALVDTVTSKLM